MKRLLPLLALLLCSHAALAQREIYDHFCQKRGCNVAYFQDFKFSDELPEMDVVVVQARSQRAWLRLLDEHRLSPDLFAQESACVFSTAHRKDLRRPAPKGSDGRVLYAQSCLVCWKGATRTLTIVFPRSDAHLTRLFAYLYGL